MFYPTFASASFGRLRRALSLVLACLLLVPCSPAFADLMLHPTRIVFDKNTRAAQVQLINNGSKPASYRISLVNRRMLESGQIEPAATAMEGERFADGMLHYSPRQVTLPPGTAQTVRIMLRKPAELAEGEYRSHLLFDKLPDVEGSASIENRSVENGQVGVVIQTLVGAAMPVIVRHGNLSANVSLDGLAIQKDASGSPKLALRLQREGSSSVYGDLNVTFTPRGGKPQQLAQIGGIAVLTPNRVRRVTLPLQVPAGVTLSGGAIEVSYRDRPEAGGKLLAESSLALP